MLIVELSFDLEIDKQSTNVSRDYLSFMVQ
jgi:hypothetical protein